MSEKSPSGLLILVLLTGIVIVGSNSFVLSPILSDVAAALGTEPVVISRVIAIYGASTAVSAFFLSPLVDRIGARRMLVIAVSTMAVALGVSAFSQSWPVLACAQSVAGIAAGVILPATYTTATASAPHGQGTRVLSRVLSGWAISLVAGVPVSALLTDVLSWRAAYGGLAFLAIACLLGIARQIGQDIRSGDARSFTPLQALRIPGVSALLVICLCYMTAFYGTYAFFGEHLRNTLGLGASGAGLAVLAYGAGFGLAGIVGGLVDRLGPARVFPAALALVAVVYGILPIAMASYPGALIAAFAWGLANHYGVNILVLLLSERQPSARGSILGLHSTVTYAAVFAGPLGAGFIYIGHGFAAICGVSLALLFFAAGIARVQRTSWEASSTREDTGPAS